MPNRPAAFWVILTLGFSVRAERLPRKFERWVGVPDLQTSKLRPKTVTLKSLRGDDRGFCLSSHSRFLFHSFDPPKSFEHSQVEFVAIIAEPMVGGFNHPH